MRPARDNSWHETHATTRRVSSFIYALMYSWPTEWLQAERTLGSYARALRTCPPEPAAAEEEEASAQEEGKGPDASSLPFDVGPRFRVGAKAGQGAFAVVRSGRDCDKESQVAIKRVQDATEDVTTLRRLLREVALLRRVRGHSNVMEIRSLLVRTRTISPGLLSRRPPRKAVDVYIVTELMMSDLGRMLDFSETTLTREQVRCLMFQFMAALAHLHEKGIIHRDIKPANLLVDKMWRLKVCDLGIARDMHSISPRTRIYEEDRDDARFTDYVVTRPYRAPELLMGSRRYDASVDMWSAGCILAELLAGQEAIDMAPLARTTSVGRIRLPLFPGKDHKDMVQRIISVLGHPTDAQLMELGKWEPKAMAFVRAQPFAHCDLETKREVYGVESVPDHCMLPTAPALDYEQTASQDKRVEWSEVFPWADPEALDLLDKLLSYDASRRPNAREVHARPRPQSPGACPCPGPAPRPAVCACRRRL